MTAVGILRIVEFGKEAMDTLAETLKLAMASGSPADEDELTIQLIEALQRRQQARRAQEHDEC